MSVTELTGEFPDTIPAGSPLRVIIVIGVGTSDDPNAPLLTGALAMPRRLAARQWRAMQALGRIARGMARRPGTGPSMRTPTAVSPQARSRRAWGTPST